MIKEEGIKYSKLCTISGKAGGCKSVLGVFQQPSSIIYKSIKMSLSLSFHHLARLIFKGHLATISKASSHRHTEGANPSSTVTWCQCNLYPGSLLLINNNALVIDFNGLVSILMGYDNIIHLRGESIHAIQGSRTR